MQLKITRDGQRHSVDEYNDVASFSLMSVSHMCIIANYCFIRMYDDMIWLHCSLVQGEHK